MIVQQCVYYTLCELPLCSLKKLKIIKKKSKRKIFQVFRFKSHTECSSPFITQNERKLSLHKQQHIIKAK